MKSEKKEKKIRPSRVLLVVFAQNFVHLCASQGRFWHLAPHSFGQFVDLTIGIFGKMSEQIVFIRWLGMWSVRKRRTFWFCVLRRVFLPLVQSQVVLQQSLLWNVATNLARSLLLNSLELTDVWSLRPHGFRTDIHMWFRLWLEMTALLYSKSTDSPSFRTTFSNESTAGTRMCPSLSCRLLLGGLDCSVYGHNQARSVRFRDSLQFLGC